MLQIQPIVSVAMFVLCFGCGASTAPDLGRPADLLGPDLAGPVMMCLSGQYLGTYTGTVTLGGILPLKTSGTVDLTLGTTSDGEFFQITNGKLVGKASGNAYTADVEGKLNCSTLKLEMGFLQNGSVTVTGLTYGFEGPMLADYDPLTATFVNATWSITQTSGPMIGASDTGMGTWTAHHM